MDLGLDTAGRWRLAGLVLGISGGYLATTYSMGSSGEMFAAPVFIAGVALGVLAGEVTLPRPERGATRMAALEVRQVRDYLPDPAARGVRIMAVALGAVALLALVSQYFWSFGPVYYAGFDPVYPSYYSSPVGIVALTALASVGAALGLAWLVLVQVARSPRTGVDGEQRHRDEVWRHRTASTITAACGVILSGVLAGILLLLGRRSTVSVLLIPAGSMMLVAFGAYTAMLLRPAPRLDPAEPAEIDSVDAEAPAAT